MITIILKKMSFNKQRNINKSIGIKVFAPQDEECFKRLDDPVLGNC